MAQTEPSQETQPELLPAEKTKNVVRAIRDTFTEEFVIGLCGPVGTPTRDVALVLEKLLANAMNYTAKTIRLSDIIINRSSLSGDEKGLHRYESLIECGNNLRATYGPSVLAELAIAEISVLRTQNIEGESEHKPQRFCHILDSIKNIEELRALKAVYGDLFICVGLYSSPDERINRLESSGIGTPEIAKLIDRDSGEEIQYGQSVRDVFSESDFFIDCSSYNTAVIESKVARILNIVLGDKIVTPTIAESSMYSAYSAGLNSACLSRQVGAAVTNKNGAVLGLGWNDVPVSGGGVYREGSHADNRCHLLGGFCRNDNEKSKIAEAVTTDLIEGGLVQAVFRERVVKCIGSGRIKGLIEFSRAVHAEMLALLNAGKSGGERMIDGDMYITTYPCHSCAKHIIAAGIKRVFYIEPYRKSLATQLHYDAISETASDDSKVILIPFEGTSPARYVRFFKAGASDRKASGKIRAMNPRFKSEISVKSLPMLEKLVVEKLVGQDLLSAD